jgi:cbb3-type cytochrome oxidase subunit 3
MKQDLFKNFTDQHLTLIGLFIFVVFFLGLLIQVYRKTQTTHYKYMSKLPISDNNGELNHE